MSNIVTCGGCGAQYDATGYQPGVQFACTNCGTLVTVPTPGIDFADQPAESQYDPGQAVAEAANAKLKAHGVRAKSNRPAGGRPAPGGRRQEPPNRRQAGAPRGGAPRGGAPKAGGRPAPRGGQPQRKQAAPAGRPAPKHAGSRGPAPKGRMAAAGGRAPARGAQRGRPRGRDDYYDEEDDYEDYPRKKDNTMLIIGIVAAVLILIVVIAFVVMGGEPEVQQGPKEPEVEVDPMAAFEQYLNNETVKATVDKFMNAIQEGNDLEYQSIVDWDKVTANAQKKMDLVKEYFSIVGLQKALTYFEGEIALKKGKNEKYDYYNKRVGNRSYVGYGIWHFVPIGEIGKEFDWLVRLEFDTKLRKWRVAEMGGFPEDAMGYKRQNFGIDNDETQEIWVYTYYFTPEQWVEFKKKELSDSLYVPQQTSEYDHRDLRKKIPWGDEPPPPGGTTVDFPAEIKNVSVGSEYSDKISGIKNGSLGSSREFSDADRNKDIVGALINIIIQGGSDGFKTKLESEAALEANKALQRIFGKDSGRSKIISSFTITKTPGDEGNNVDDDTLLKVLDVVVMWIEEYKKQGWSVE